MIARSKALLAGSVLAVAAVLLLALSPAASAQSDGSEPAEVADDSPPADSEDTGSDETDDEPSTGPTSTPAAPYSGYPPWLPQQPKIEHRYSSAEAYQVQQDLCNDESGQSANPALWEVFGNAEWQCGSTRRSATSGPTSIGDDLRVSWGGESQIDISKYDIGADSGGIFDWSMVQGLTHGAFEVNTWVVSASALILSWGFDFTVVAALADAIGAIGFSLYGSTVDLIDLGFFIALAYAGYHVLWKRLQQGLSELLITMVLFGLMLFFQFDSPQGYSGLVSGGLGGASEIGCDLAAQALGDGSGDRQTTASGCGQDSVVGPALAWVHELYVDRPYDAINWGGPIPEQCLAARDLILRGGEWNGETIAGGPWGDDDKPRWLMGQAGCEAQADFNHEPTMERFGLAAVALGGSFTGLFLITLVGIGLLASQLVFAWRVGFLSLAFISAMLPGDGRVQFWELVKSLVKTLFTIVGLYIALVFYLLVARAMFDVGAERGWGWLRVLMLNGVVTVTAIYVLWRVVRSSRAVAKKSVDKVSNASAGYDSGRAKALLEGERSPEVRAVQRMFMGGVAARGLRGMSRGMSLSGGVRGAALNVRDLRTRVAQRGAIAKGASPVPQLPALGLTRKARARRDMRRAAVVTRRRAASDGAQVRHETQSDRWNQRVKSDQRALDDARRKERGIGRTGASHREVEAVKRERAVAEQRLSDDRQQRSISLRYLQQQRTAAGKRLGEAQYGRRNAPRVSAANQQRRRPDAQKTARRTADMVKDMQASPPPRVRPTTQDWREKNAYR